LFEQGRLRETIRGVVSMLHEPAAPVGKDLAAPYKAKLGIWMFWFYCVLYMVFVAINVARPAWMEVDVWRGLNLATVYGFVLIALALILALIYDMFCRKRERALREPVSQEGRP